MKTAFIVQARVGSSRLPNKILLPFYGEKCILQLLFEKLSVFKKNIRTIVATSTNKENDVIENFCNIHNIDCFRGDENDVLKRFIDAAQSNGIERIIRICSDNPFLELESIKEIITKSNQSTSEYISFKINGVPSIKTHYGFWTEYVTLKALKKVQLSTNEKIYHEHVTNYIYTNPKNFKIDWIEGPEYLKDKKIRLTIDTVEDFKNAQKIFADMYITNPYPSINQIVDYLEENPEMYNTMIEQINKNSK